MRRVAAVLVGAGVALASTVAAQAASNNVSLGQTGVTNTITITQTGLGNSVGADDSSLLLNQDGRSNTVDITQTGWTNTVAAVVRFALTTPYFVPANGINQIGNFNSLLLNQTDTASSGFNTIEAIYQQASDGFAMLSNFIDVVQTGDGGTGAAQHFIGEIVQINNSPGMAANSVSVTQSGGGAGIGNSIERIRQRGDGNILDVIQAALSNMIGIVSQIGSGNDAVISQATNGGNVVSSVMQTGDLNEVNIAESGIGNYVETLTQDNAGVAISGNTSKITLAGDDNGGDGLGGLGTFATAVRTIGVFQATVLQIGDDNDLSYAVSASSSGSQYGFMQDGDGNGIIGNVEGIGNEAGVRQTGDDNNVSFSQKGNVNAVAVTMDGERNRAFIDQTGQGNVVSLSFGSRTTAGSDNNPDGLAFTGGLAATAGRYGLAPGHFHQAGSLNSASLTVDGNGNMNATWQEGAANMVSGSVAGLANQVAVVQVGDNNIAGFSQVGNNNQLIIQQ
jgi:hypothetical protein